MKFTHRDLELIGMAIHWVQFDDKNHNYLSKEEKVEYKALNSKITLLICEELKKEGIIK